MGFFGPSKAEIWQQLAAKIGADYLSGNFWLGDRVEAKVGEWILVLDTHYIDAGKHKKPWTRIRAPYNNLDNFYFKIYRKTIFSSIGKALGMQDITIGIPEFDEKFIIQSNDEAKIRQLLASDVIRQLIAVQPAFHLEVIGSEYWRINRFPEGVDELYFEVLGVIKDVRLLEQLYELFSEVLHRLCEMGSADSGDPQVRI